MTSDLLLNRPLATNRVKPRCGKRQSAGAVGHALKFGTDNRPRMRFIPRAFMPKRTDIHSVLIIGAGPIIIGQACEFDYSGTQACKALKEEGYRVILVNSNPATIMTDPEFADRTYLEPITPECIEKIIAREVEEMKRLKANGKLVLAADARRPNRAQHRDGPFPPRDARQVRHRDDRRQCPGHRAR